MEVVQRHTERGRPLEAQLKKIPKSSMGAVGGKGERDHLLSLRSMPTPGALCCRAEAG